MSKTFEELGNETLLVVLHIVVVDIKEQRGWSRKKRVDGLRKIYERCERTDSRQQLS